MKFSKKSFFVVKKYPVFMSILMMSLISLALISFIQHYGDSTSENPIEAVGTILENPDLVTEEYIPEPTIEISADHKSAYGVKTDSSFTITHLDKVSEEDIASSFSIEPAMDFQISFIEGTQYRLSFNESLPKNHLLKMRYTYQDELYGYAFKTEEPFRVSGVYPERDSENVSINSGIEITFSRIVTKEAADYFVIEPFVEGTFLTKDYTLTFVPKEEYQENTKYTVSIKDGYTIDDEISESYNFSFKTDYMYGDSIGLGDKKVNVMSGSDYQILNVYSGYENTLNSLDLEVYQITSDMEALLALYNHNEVMNAIEDGKATFVKKIKAEKVDNNWYMSQFLLQETLGKGNYYIVTTQNNSSSGCFIQVTDKNAYLSVDVDECIVWVQEEGNMDLSGQVYLGDKLVGQLDKNGFVNIKESLPQKETAYVHITIGNETLYLPTYINEDYSYMGDYYYRYLYTDRGIYKTSDSIKTTGFIKDRRGNSVKEVTINYIYNGAVFESQKVPVSKIGTFESEYKYKDYFHQEMEVNLEVEGAQIISRWLPIADYEKPTYYIESSLDKEFVNQGGEFNYFGKIAYYDGTPLIGGTLHLDLYNGENYITDLNDKKQSTGFLKTENGEYNQTYKLYSKSKNWRPVSFVMQTSTREIQDFYQSDVKHIYVFPKTMMIENTLSNLDTNTIKMDIACHNVDTSLIKTSIFDENEYRGSAIANKEVDIEVTETYYEKVFVKQVYNSIYKEYYDKYDYVKHVNNVYKSTGKTDEQGNISFVYDQAVENRYYKVIVSSTDGNQSKVIEESGIGNYFDDWYYDNLPIYELVADDYAVPYNTKMNMELLKRGESMEENPIDQLLIIEERDGIVETHLTDKTQFSILFDESKIPDTNIKVVYFNGRSMASNSYMSKWLEIKADSRELSIEAVFDKENYRPGDELNYTIRIKDANGQPIEGEVNLSVVDEAIFALVEDSSNPLMYLYGVQRNRNIIGEYLFFNNDMAFNGAEQGGEGGIEGLRSDFKDTAFFKNIKTNKDGIASGKLTLPDNITTWRFTLQGFSQDGQTGKIKYKVQSGLPFFVDVQCQEEYLSGDDIYIRVKSAGSSMFIGEDVTYDLWVEDSSNTKIIEESIDTSFNIAKYMGLSKLGTGKYNLFVRLKHGENIDVVQLAFEVKDQVANYNLSTTESLTTNTKLIHNNNMVDITIFNEEAHKFYLKLMSLTYGKEDKNFLRRLTALLAKDYVNELFNLEILNQEISNQETNKKIELYPYIDMTGLIKSLENASGDPVTTARLLAIGLGDKLYIYDTNQIQAYAEDKLKQKLELNPRYLGSLWILSTLDKPDTERLDEAILYYKDIPTIESQLILIQSLLDAGELTKGRKLLDRFIWDNKIDLSKTVYRFSEDKANDELITYMLLSAMVKLEENQAAERIMEKINRKSANSRLLYYANDPEVFMYYKSLEVPELNARLSLAYGDEKVEETLTFEKIFRTVLSPEEAENFTVKGFNGKLVIEKNYIGKANELSKMESRKVRKTYKNIDGSTSIHVGDVVVVELTFPRNSYNTYFDFQDPLPAGLTFLKTVDLGRFQYMYGNPFGNLVDLWGGVSTLKGIDQELETEIVFKYHAIATKPGTYQAEPIVITDRSNLEHWIGEPTWITIEK